jgi:hypothetical protein
VAIGSDQARLRALFDAISRAVSIALPGPELAGGASLHDDPFCPR